MKFSSQNFRRPWNSVHNHSIMFSFAMMQKILQVLHKAFKKSPCEKTFRKLSCEKTFRKLSFFIFMFHFVERFEIPGDILIYAFLFGPFVVLVHTSLRKCTSASPSPLNELLGKMAFLNSHYSSWSHHINY